MICGESLRICIAFGRCARQRCGQQISKLRKTGWQPPSENLSEFVRAQILMIDRSQQPFEHPRERSFTRKRDLHLHELDSRLRLLTRHLVGFPKRSLNELEPMRQALCRPVLECRDRLLLQSSIETSSDGILSGAISQLGGGPAEAQPLLFHPFCAVSDSHAEGLQNFL